MAALTKQKQFKILRLVLGMVEEQKSVSLGDCAAAAGVDDETLRSVLGAVLYLNYDTSRDHLLVDESAAFFLDENDRISLTADHWLRELEATTPDRDGALRLLIAGQTMQTLLSKPDPALDRAVAKLRDEVAVELRIPVDVPPALAIVREAMIAYRSIKIHYRRDGSDSTTPRELLPFRIWSRWGNWYLSARDLTEKETKTFRLDRIIDVEIGEQEMDQIPWTEVPESFVLSDRTQIIRIAIAADAIDSLPSTTGRDNQTDIGNGRVEIDVTVSGEQQINHLLISLPADAEVISPPEFAARRRTLAAELLAELN